MQWFPFTSFNTKPAALYLSDHAVTVIRLGAERGIRSFGRVPLDHTVLEDGIVLDRDKLIRAIRSAFANARPEAIALDEEIPVVLAVPESKSFTHLFTLSATQKSEDIRGVVSKKAAQFVPVDIDSLYWDAHIVDKSAGATMRVFFAAAPREIIDAYISVAEECNLLPVAIDMEAIAAARALAGSEPLPTAIMDIGARTTSVGFFDESGRLGLSISIPVAGNAFTRSLVEHMHISWDDAEELKMRQGMNRAIPDNRAIVILQERLQFILHEFTTALSYYEGSYGKRIERIILSGGSASLPDISVYFGMNVKYPVHIGDPYRNISLRHSVLPDISHPIVLAPAIGLALRAAGNHPEKGGINLLKGWEGERWEERERKILFRWKKLAIPVFTASIVLFSYVLIAYLYLPYVRLTETNRSRVIPILDGATSSNQTGNAPTGTLAEEAEAARASTSTKPDEKTASGIQPGAPDEALVSTTTSQKSRVSVLATPTGWLRVRVGPGTSYAEITKIYPGESYVLLDTEGDWSKLRFQDGGYGWAASQYLSLENIERRR